MIGHRGGLGQAGRSTAPKGATTPTQAAALRQAVITQRVTQGAPVSAAAAAVNRPTQAATATPASTPPTSPFGQCTSQALQLASTGACGARGVISGTPPSCVPSCGPYGVAPVTGGTTNAGTPVTTTTTTTTTTPDYLPWILGGAAVLLVVVMSHK